MLRQNKAAVMLLHYVVIELLIIDGHSYGSLLHGYSYQY